jgi:hypothetical protein
MAVTCFIVFNRPKVTRAAFQQIAQAQPAKLMIAADGPRADVATDLARCEEVRSIVSEITWPCEIQTAFSDTNLGPETHVPKAISLALDMDEAVIIIEDDCIVNEQFHPFCEELLSRYRNDERVMTVSGTSFIGRNWESPGTSYYFSRYPACWGWATWKRAWQFYDPALPDWSTLRQTSWLTGVFGHTANAAYWKQAFDEYFHHPSWDTAWFYACLTQYALSVSPAQNLVTNIGWGAEATHTRDHHPQMAFLPTGELGFPLRHPQMLLPDYDAERHRVEQIFRILETDWRSRLSRRITRLKQRLNNSEMWK